MNITDEAVMLLCTKAQQVADADPLLHEEPPVTVEFEQLLGELVSLVSLHVFGAGAGIHKFDYDAELYAVEITMLGKTVNINLVASSVTVNEAGVSLL